MMRRWWRSLGFYWQVYIFMILSFGFIITVVEAVVEPYVLATLANVFAADPMWYETLVWIGSVLLPTLLLGYLATTMIMRKLTTTVDMAKRLSRGDLGARIAVGGDGGDVFNQLAAAFNDMAGSLERLLDNEKRLLADISHELRSPLTRMGIATALLPIKRDGDDFDATVAALEREVEQMNALVALLLEHGRERLSAASHAAVEVGPFARELVESFLPVAEDQGKTIVLHAEPAVVVWGDPVHLRTIVDNVLANALFYSPPGGQVLVVVARDAHDAHITIRDVGPGVPDKHLADIFRAFFRVDVSRARDSGGVGLGLALAQDAAVALGGAIAARNAHPGLEVHARLPLATREQTKIPT